MTAVRMIRTICLLTLGVCLAVTVAQAVMAGDENAGAPTAAAEAGPSAASSEATRS